MQGATSLPAQDANWVKAIYDFAVGRDPLDPEKTRVLKALDTAEGNARRAIARVLTSSSIYRAYFIKLAYETYQGRDPSATDLAKALKALAQPSGGPGSLTNDERLIASLLASQEYFFRQTDSAGLHTNVSWVDGLFTSLGVPIDPVLASATVTKILNGYVKQRTQAVQALLASVPYRTVIIIQDYQTYLRRLPTQTEINNALAAFAAGGTREQEIANLLATNEYFNLAPSIMHKTSPPTNKLFVQAAFSDLFPASPATAADISTWADPLNAGTLDRATVALDLTTSHASCSIHSSAW